MNYMDQCIIGFTYMCIQSTRDICSVVITRQSNPHVSMFNRQCNEFTSVCSVFLCNNSIIKIAVRNIIHVVIKSENKILFF